MTNFSCHNLSIEVGQGSSKRSLLKNLDFNLEPGDVMCILGKNGSGKSSLLHALAGLSYVSGGHVEVQKKKLTTYKRKDLARELGLVRQTHDDPFPITVFDFAIAGRHPYLGLLDWESKEDKHATENALQQLSLYEKREQLVQTLSGGERKRLSIARLLTQDPNILLWDEPTNHLDPAQQKHVLKLINILREQGKTQIIALHDINHAARIATQILFMYEDEQWEIGTVKQMLENQKLEGLYQTEFRQMNFGPETVFALS